MRDDKREGKMVVYIKAQCHYERVRKIKEMEGMEERSNSEKRSAKMEEGANKIKQNRRIGLQKKK